MSAPAFLDASHAPTNAEIETALRGAAPLWPRLLEWLDEPIRARGTLRWDGPRFGWCLAVRRSGRPFVTLTPIDGGFEAMVVLGAKEAALTEGLGLSRQLRDRLEELPQLRDGKWLFLEIRTAAELADLETLLLAKLPPTVRARVAVSRRGAEAALRSA
jgi:hypothetical protein